MLPETYARITKARNHITDAKARNIELQQALEAAWEELYDAALGEQGSDLLPLRELVRELTVTTSGCANTMALHSLEDRLSTVLAADPNLAPF